MPPSPNSVPSIDVSSFDAKTLVQELPHLFEQAKENRAELELLLQHIDRVTARRDIPFETFQKLVDLHITINHEIIALIRKKTDEIREDIDAIARARERKRVRRERKIALKEMEERLAGHTSFLSKYLDASGSLLAHLAAPKTEVTALQQASLVQVENQLAQTSAEAALPSGIEYDFHSWVMTLLIISCTTKPTQTPIPSTNMGTYGFEYWFLSLTMSRPQTEVRCAEINETCDFKRPFIYCRESRTALAQRKEHKKHS